MRFLLFQSGRDEIGTAKAIGDGLGLISSTAIPGQNSHRCEHVLTWERH